MDTSFSEIPDLRLLWPQCRPTGLAELPRLAQRAGVGRVFVKLENQRPLGNFKSLGGVIAGLRALARHSGVQSIEELQRSGPRVASELTSGLTRLLCASEGNHGLAVAAAARFASTVACVYLPSGVSAERAERVAALGAQVIRVNGTYDEAVHAAQQAAASGAGLLIPDTSDDPDDQVVNDVMDGYKLITRELAGQLSDPPSHAFVQAGVGGLAAAIARGLAGQWRQPVQLLTVEPESAACVARALALGFPRLVEGALQTCATMLACGVASASAVRVLLHHRARAVMVCESELLLSVRVLQEAGGPVTTPSGAAGVAGLLRVADDARARRLHGLDANSRVLLLVTEGMPHDAHPPRKSTAHT